MLKDHAAALLSLGIIGAIFLTLVLHGMKDETIVAILATGAVGIANTIAGVRQVQTPPPGGTSMVSVSAPPDPNSQPLNGAKDTTK